MPTKILRDPDHVDALAAMLRFRKLPITVTWTQGAPRTTAQNRLAQRWFTDIARQLGDQTHEDVRAECKMLFGVPILRAENEAFRLSYDRVLRALPYEQKLAAQAMAMQAAQGGQQQGGVPTPTLPGGMPMGGQQANTVMNRDTGGAG